MMKVKSLQWRIALMTSFLIAMTCLVMMVLLGDSGLRRIDEIGESIKGAEIREEVPVGETPDASAHPDIQASFDPSQVGKEDPVTIVIDEARDRFTANNLYITLAVTLVSGIIASFAAQKQFTGNAAHELRTPLSLLFRLFYNLTENAIKYGRPGGLVEIGVEKAAGRAIARVKDSGYGIPKENQKDIFQAFYRLSSPESQKEKGVGLGLALAHEICRLHGGRIEVEESDSTGTVMLVDLPVED